MATLLYLIVDPADDAGPLGQRRPPAAARWCGRRRRAARFLEGGRSVPLGVLPFPSFEEVVEPLHPGTTVVLYTDGLVERPGRAPRRRSRPAGRGGRRGARGSRGALRPRAREARARRAARPTTWRCWRFRTRRWSTASASSSRRSPRRSSSMRGLLRRWLRHADGERAGDGGDHHRLRRGRDQRDRARGRGRRDAVRGRRALEDGVVDITVRDYGAWRPPREGDQGRGLSLMRALMETVEVAAGPDGTRVRLRRGLGRGERRRAVTERLVQLEISERGEIVVARVTGELDIAGAPSTGERIAGAVPDLRARAGGGLLGLDFIDSSGIAMLFSLARQLGSRRQELRVVAPAAGPSRGCSRSSSSSAPRRCTPSSTMRSPEWPARRSRRRCKRIDICVSQAVAAMLLLVAFAFWPGPGRRSRPACCPCSRRCCRRARPAGGAGRSGS